MNNKVTIVSLIVFVIIVAGLVVYGIAIEDKDVETSASSSGSGDAVLSISPSLQNLGSVSQKEGKVSTSFTIKNTGTSDLVIDDMLSSCSCTSARLVVNGKEGPSFGMHNNPKNWSATILPGESTELNVYYDPDVHKDFRGSATREITLFSNDSKKSETKVSIKLNQVD